MRKTGMADTNSTLSTLFSVVLQNTCVLLYFVLILISLHNKNKQPHGEDIT